jgi:hypothetical protein
MYPGMAYDPIRKKTVLFGGVGSAASKQFQFGDTWEWDGQYWTQVSEFGPQSRTQLAMAYDFFAQRVLLFGGSTGELGNILFADTWHWDGENWTQVADSGPAGRLSHAMASDSARKRVSLFGGEGFSAPGKTVFFGDTWEWDGEQWTQQEVMGPGPRRLHCMTYDVTRGRLVLFGGFGDSGFSGETWEWDSSLWARKADIGPGPLGSAAMAYDGAESVLFGGQNSVSAFLGNTWSWDGKFWTQRQDMGPSPRYGHAIAYDQARSVYVLFGGDDGTNFLADTWELRV